MNKDDEYVICPFCGFVVSKKNKFCPECGGLLNNAETATEEIVKKFKETEQKKLEKHSTASNIGFISSDPFPVNIPIMQVDSDGRIKQITPLDADVTTKITADTATDAMNDAIADVAADTAPDLVTDAIETEAVDDANLTILVDYCKRTVATVGGDGYSETILYRNDEDGTYQIHTYSKYEYMEKETHQSYKAKDGAWDAALSLIDTLGLLAYEGKRGIGLCGGMYICKFLKDGTLHRITTDNMGTDGSSLIAKVGNLLGSYIGEELTKD